MENFVVSKDLAEKLKEADFPQTTHWFWEEAYATSEMGRGHPDYKTTPPKERNTVSRYGWRVVTDYRHNVSVPEVVFNWWWGEVQKIHEAHIAAPLSDEILAWLPARLNRKDRSSWNLTIWKTEKNLDGEVHYSADYTEGMTSKMLVGKTRLEQDKLPDALAELWLFCKANNYLEKE